MKIEKDQKQVSDELKKMLIQFFSNNIFNEIFNERESLFQIIPFSYLFQVLGYICVLLYGFTAFVGYRRWRIQCHLFKRRKLLESEDFLELL